MPAEKPEEQTEHKVAEELAKRFAYNPKKLRELCAFVGALHEFSHQLQENRYYSEALAKKVFELTMEFDSISLEIEGLRMRSEELQSDIETAILAKTKISVDARQGAALKKDVDAAWKKALGAHGKLDAILAEIRSEYKQKML